ncbi:ATPase [Methanobrevibacter ruminantium M1]|uniref:ATPase n=1 Tax=Methanobrevibacter ruminantium (strain ATCC 35063 / DSM 1093 / JCM 13430 / OCM 146 / M1) TaxID=634498 RepID=D3E4J6_METRM|nr:ATP-binding protein [Methanobrevibacter ruminantium]ADC45892.1 ATPase [Methanobrevibacter ruminantium M1]
MPSKIIKREAYIRDLKDYVNTDFVKVYIGIRRSGKTSLMHNIIDELKRDGVNDENIIFMSFESREYIHINNSEQLDELVYKKVENLEGKIYLFFDEIQQVKGWEKSINSYRVSIDSDIYITGSNSKLLSGELATLLTGRYLTIHVYPFSFKEFLQYKNEIEGVEITKYSIDELYEEYFNFGGMPGILSLGSDEFKRLALKDIYNSILFEDVVSRFNISNIDLLQRFSRYMISSTGEIFSSKSIKNYLKSNDIYTSEDTLLKYNEYLKQSFFISKCKCFHLKGKKEMKILGKYYLTDHGFHHALIEDNILKVTKILENIVYVELLRRGYKVNVGRNEDKTEVDFVCEKSGKYKYIQVSYRLTSEQTLNREINPLLRIPDKYESILITTENHDFSKDGVRHLNIVDFLCGDDV